MSARVDKPTAIQFTLSKHDLHVLLAMLRDRENQLESRLGRGEPDPYDMAGKLEHIQTLKNRVNAACEALR